jgi:hypothetical protein
VGWIGRIILTWIKAGLTWIKAGRCLPPFKGKMLSRRYVPAIRHCPLCGIAMQASKSREVLEHFDTFRCLTCHTTILETASADRSAPPSNN